MLILLLPLFVSLLTVSHVARRNGVLLCASFFFHQMSLPHSHVCFVFPFLARSLIVRFVENNFPFPSAECTWAANSQLTRINLLDPLCVFFSPVHSSDSTHTPVHPVSVESGGLGHRSRELTCEYCKTTAATKAPDALPPTHGTTPFPISVFPVLTPPPPPLLRFQFVCFFRVD